MTRDLSAPGATEATLEQQTRSLLAAYLAEGGPPGRARDAREAQYARWMADALRAWLRGDSSGEPRWVSAAEVHLDRGAEDEQSGRWAGDPGDYDDSEETGCDITGRCWT